MIVSYLHHRKWIALAALAACALAWTWHAVSTRAPMAEATPVADAKQIRARPLPTMPRIAGEPPKLRRLLSTRLGHPRILRISHARTVRTPTYAGVVCGEAAWGDTPAAAEDFRRFIATKRNVLLEGSADFDATWRRVCAARLPS